MSALPEGLDEAADAQTCHELAFAHHMRYLTAAERRLGGAQLRRVVAGRAATEADRSPVAQDPEPILTALLAAARDHDEHGSGRNYEAAVTRFLTLGKSAKELRADVGRVLDSIRDALEHDYVLDNGELGLQGKGPESSALAPRLRWAHVGARGVRGIMDWASRVVVKAYALTAPPKAPSAPVKGRRGAARARAPAGAAPYRDGDELFEIALDLLISATVVNGFVTDYADVVTPHFVYQVDWFLGPPVSAVRARTDGVFEPEFAPGTPNTPKEVTLDAKVATAPLVEYVVNEAMDVEFSKLLEASTTDAGMDRYEGRWNLLSFRALLTQYLLALDAAFDVAGFQHNDFHAGNAMVTIATREAESPFTEQTLVYRRGDVHRADRRLFAIPAAEHNNMVGQIIDFGRARAFARRADVVDEEPVLLANPYFAEFGIYGVGDERLDRSWDVRRLGIDMVAHVDLGRLARAVPDDAGVDVASVLAAAKLTLVVMAHLEHFALVCASDALAANAVAKKRDADDVEYARSVSARFATLVRDNAAVFSAPDLGSYARAALNKMAASRAVALYDLIQPLLAEDGVYDAVNDVIFAWRTMRAVFTGRLDAPENGRHPALSAGTCLDHMPFFAPLAVAPAQEPRLADAVRDGTALVVGVVRSDMVAFDPVTGRAPEGEPPPSASPASPARPRGEKRAPSASPERAASGDRPAGKRRRLEDSGVLACETCGAPSAGAALEHPGADITWDTLRPFCGPLCMEHAVSMGRVKPTL
jgi:hypothetical protein